MLSPGAAEQTDAATAAPATAPVLLPKGDETVPVTPLTDVPLDAGDFADAGLPEPAAVAATTGSRTIAAGLPVFDPPPSGPEAVAAASLALAVASGTPEISTPTAPNGGRRALAWVDESAVGRIGAPGDLTAATTPYVSVETDLLADAPPRSPLRPGVLVPTLIAASLVGAYAGTTLMWPLHAVAPTVSAVEVTTTAAPAATPAWPGVGSAAIGVQGIPGALASSVDAAEMASITKVVTALVVLDRMPLAVGEQGPEFRFTGADNLRYWQYRSNGESALDVPVGGTLTQYQMLEGMLIGSANNYADRLAQNLFPSDAVFASAAADWLSTHGVSGITVVEPTGMDPGNRASPEALITLAQRALAHPVIAEIVAKPSVELPGAGLVQNTNALLADPGVVGIKTGTLEAWNLLSAKDIAIGDTTVRTYAAVLGQPDEDSRIAASRALYAQLEQELQPTTAVPAGTVAGRVETRWADPVDVITAADASVVLWNGAAGTPGTTFSLGDARAKGATVGALTVDGPLNSTEVELKLAAEVPEPSPWWRLTHPLDLFGLN